MAAKQRSTAKKPRKRISSPSRKTTWSAYMQGTDVEWMDSPEAVKLAQVFGCALPQWLIESDPWRKITGGHFQSIRKSILGLSIAQVAAYLRVTQYEVKGWESGRKPVPFSAYETLRLLCRTADYRLSHRRWDGWFINRKTGDLISPDLGKLEISPEEINGIPLLHNRLSILQTLTDQQVRQIDALEAENARLRNQSHNRQVATELEAIQERVATLLDGIKTAEILPFTQASEELTLRAVA